MTDWTDIHEDFTDELQDEWEKIGFKYWQVQEWIDVGLLPEDAKFALYIESRGYITDDIERKEGKLNKLRAEYEGHKVESDSNSSSDEEEGEIRVVKKRKIDLPERDWTNINSNFTPELVQEWKNCGFDYEECADWLSVVSTEQQISAIYDSAYYAWLRDAKKVNVEWTLNYGDEEQLRNEYQEYLTKLQTTQQIQK